MDLYLNFGIDGLFFLDIMINFISTYEVSGREEFSCKKITWNYLTGWFLIDLAATFPTGVLELN